jgi:hypothetical protein
LKFFDVGDIVVDFEKMILLPNQFLTPKNRGVKEGILVALRGGVTFRNDKNVPIHTTSQNSADRL